MIPMLCLRDVEKINIYPRFVYRLFKNKQTCAGKHNLKTCVDTFSDKIFLNSWNSSPTRKVFSLSSFEPQKLEIAAIITPSDPDGTV